MKKAVLVLFSAVFGLFGVYDARAQTVRGDGRAPVTISSSSQSASILLPGQINTFRTVIKNISDARRQILVDLELYSSLGKKVIQKTYIRRIDANGSANFSLPSPFRLDPGTYIWKVGIFNPNWKGLIEWNDRVLDFSVYNTRFDDIYVLRVDKPRIVPVSGSDIDIAVRILSPRRDYEEANFYVYLLRNDEPGFYYDVYEGQDLFRNDEREFTLRVPAILEGEYIIGLTVLDSKRDTVQSFPDLGSVTVR